MIKKTQQPHRNETNANANISTRSRQQIEPHHCMKSIIPIIGSIILHQQLNMKCSTHHPRIFLQSEHKILEKNQMSENNHTTEVMSNCDSNLIENVAYSEIRLQQTLSNSPYYNLSILISHASSLLTLIKTSKTTAIPQTIDLGILTRMLYMATI